MTKEEAKSMTKEEAKSFLIDISYKLGNMAIEYLTEKDGEKMREAIEVLEQEKSETVTEFADRCRECGARYGKLLKQKTVLLENLENALFIYDDTDCIKVKYIRQLLDKYKAESENKK